MGIVQLEMMLSVVIRLIIIIMHIAELVIVLSCRIITSVGLVHIRTDSLPCDSSPLRAHQPCHPQRITFIHPTQNSHGRMNVGKSVSDVSVSKSAGICRIEIKAGRQKS